MKTYLLKPNMTFTTLNPQEGPSKPALSPPLSKAADRATRQILEAIAPAPPASPKTVAIDLAAPPATKTSPSRQPLPKPVLYPDKPSLKLGLDVHLEFIMAVAQREHASPQAPRKFTPIRQRPKFIARKKGPRNRKQKEKTLLIKTNPGAVTAKKNRRWPGSITHRCRARLRSTPLRSARPTLTERKNLADI